MEDHYKNTVYIKFAHQVVTRGNCQIPAKSRLRRQRNVCHSDVSCVQLQMHSTHRFQHNSICCSCIGLKKRLS